MIQIEEIDRLLGEWPQLDLVAADLQQKSGITPEIANTVQETYLRWLHDAYAFLPEFYQPQFWLPYEGIAEVGVGGGSTTVGIRQFITDPLRKERAFNLAAVYSRTPVPPEYEWAYPCERYFAPRFKEQRRVLLDAREWYRAQARMQQHSPVQPPKLHSLSLHPRIVEVAEARFSSGHYDDAVAHSIVAVNEAVRRKSGSDADDGVALMQKVLSAKRPLLRLSEREDEQRAYMDLFAAAWSALRNPRAHSTVGRINDAHAAIELLAFASALMRLVDESQKVNEA